MTDQNDMFTEEAVDAGVIQCIPTAYIRAVRVADLEPEIKTPEGLDIVYAMHDPNGRRLALFDNRDLAFSVARSNEINPVSVH